MPAEPSPAELPPLVTGRAATVRTLPLRVELARQLTRRRTQLTLGFMAALPVILAVAFAFGDDASGGGSFIDLATRSAANFALVNIFFSASFLLIVVVALFFGDTVASEASWSTLKYLLAVPVPRRRLLRQKFLAAGVWTTACLVLLPVTAWLLGAVLYGTGPMISPTGDSFAGGAALLRLAVIVGFLCLNLCWVAGLAFLLSVYTENPLSAVGGAVLVSILSQILDQIDALGAVREWLPTHFAYGFVQALSEPLLWDDMSRGALAGLGYGLLFTGWAFVYFERKDITT